MQKGEFEKLVGEGFEKLPEWVRNKIQNVALLVELVPSDEDRHLQSLHDEETLLGLYKGVPLSERGDLYGVGGTLPDTITIYMLPTLEMADEVCALDAPPAEYREHVRRIVADTVWHEFAHHFGMDEGEVQARGGQTHFNRYLCTQKR